MLASASAAVAGALLGVAGAAHAALLLGTVLVVGAALVVVGVAWQSLLPDLVGRGLLGSATVVDGADLQHRAGGRTALAGVGLGLAGSTTTFLVVAGAFTACGSVFLVLDSRRPGRRGPRRPIVPDIVQGLRFARFSPWTRRLLTRMVVFGFPASALWALVSLVAHDRLGLGAGGFGVVMALLGSGAVVATLLLPPLRARLSVPVFAALGSAAYALTMLVLGTGTTAVAVGAVLVLGGVAWVGVQSTWMMLAHQAVPEWVRPRIIALLLFLFQGTQAIGAVAVGRRRRPPRPAGASPVRRRRHGRGCRSLWRGLGPAAGIEPLAAMPDAGGHRTVAAADDGELEVRYEYAVPQGRAGEFGAAIRRLRLSRMRLGARDWALEPRRRRRPRRPVVPEPGGPGRAGVHPARPSRRPGCGPRSGLRPPPSTAP